MSDSIIKIFYSWQSDLPGNETRSIIQEGIKEAVKLLRDTVDIEADRDTQGESGSPDIAQTIFSKIDDCDIFVADVTAVTDMEITKANGETILKKIPNPNVMLELGYATKVVGWENVICVLNTDYGAIQNMPFDISSRRLTPFSLKDGKSKGEVIRYIRDVIEGTVKNILENGKRVKTGFSDLRIGCLDNGKLVDSILPVKLSESNKYVAMKRRTARECSDLYRKLKEFKILLDEESDIEKESEEVTNDKEKSLELLAATLSCARRVRVKIKDKEKEEIKLRYKKYVDGDVDFDESIFNFGKLEKKYDLLQQYSLDGTEEEEEKYNYYEQLEVNLFILDLWEKYITTFDECVFLPLVIENKSYKADEDIDVYVKINPEELKIVYPSERLICPELKGLESIIYEEDIVKTLLKMEENSSVCYDEDISYSILDSQAEARALLNARGINGNPRYSSEDYARELRKYIAIPMEDNNGEFMFNIKSMKPSEKKWLGPALLIKPLVGNFDISYSIKSKQSDGNLSGTMSFRSEE